MTEATLNQYLVQKFRELGAHVTRIENVVSSGAPDINMYAPHREVWFENKVCAYSDGRHAAELRASQWSWMTARRAAKGSSFVLIFNKTTNTIALFESETILANLKPLWVTDEEIGGIKPAIRCDKKLFVQKFLDKYCESTGVHLRTKPVAPSFGDAPVAF